MSRESNSEKSVSYPKKDGIMDCEKKIVLYDTPNCFHLLICKMEQLSAVFEVIKQILYDRYLWQML